MSSAITKVDSVWLSTQAQMLDVALRAASQLKNARGLIPESLKSEGEIVAVLLAGAELGISPMAALRSLQVVRGKVIISYDLMIGLLRRAGYKIEWPVASAAKAQLRLTAPDGTQHVETWDEARAKKAGLWGNKGPWSQYPETMLKARCVSSAARAFAGEVLAGVYCEEAAEIGPSAQVTTLRSAAPAADVVDAETGEVHEAPPPTTLGKCTTLDQTLAWIRARVRPGWQPDRAKIDAHLAKLLGDAPEDEHNAVRTMVDDALGVRRETDGVESQGDIDNYSRGELELDRDPND